METATRVQTLYELWLTDPNIDEATKAELRTISDQPKEIEDRFYKDVEFGTGGLRGVIGAGTNRMNKYTVGRATQGLAQFLLSTQPTGGSAVIAYDSRYQSPEFALEAALVFAGNGIKAYVFESLRPTPELSFAVRFLGASAGIVVTASHNPPEYNGYKVYGTDGGQLVPSDAEQVIEIIQNVKSFSSIRSLARKDAESQGLLTWVGREVDEAYITAVKSMSLNPKVITNINENFRIVFTPLHGAGNHSVRQVLKQVGFTNVEVVAEQEHPDSQFSTVKSPNPEEKEAFTLALKLAEEVEADIIIGTDPDCDRMGAVVKNYEGQYEVLSGNQSGALMVHYVLNSLQLRGALPPNGIVIKTIVTSEMGAVIAQSFGVPTLNTLTGFKYIGEKITQFAATGEHRFLFGYEESYGYLTGTYARDKDAVVASLLICEAAAYYKSLGKSLYQVLQELYGQFGYFLEKLESRTLKGMDGLAQIGKIMNRWREQPPEKINGKKIVKVMDYSLGLEGLPRENVLKYVLEDQSWFCLRPSGTEPKIKVYFAVCETSADLALTQINGLMQSVMAKVDEE